MVYKFKAQNDVGDKGAAILDEYFTNKRITVHPVSLKEDKKGYDRMFGDEFKVEYKTDTWYKKTGNVALELVSNTTTGKLGWIYTSQADRFVYYGLGSGMAFIWEPKVLLKSINKLMRHRLHAAENPNYHSINLIVPGTALEPYIRRRIRIDESIENKYLGDEDGQR